MTPVRLLHLEMMGFLYSLAAIIVYQLLTRRIHVSGLLSHKTGKSDGPEQISPGRVQLLLATLAVSAKFLRDVAAATDGNLPDFDHRWLYVMGGSSGIYTLEKALALWNRNRTKNS